MPVQTFKAMTRRISLLLVGALLFGQVALAAHACLVTGAAPISGHSSALATHVATDSADLAECMGHCQTAQQHVDDRPLPLPTLAWAPALATSLPWAHAGTLEIPTPRRLTPAHTAQPRHTILHCCWRI